MWHWPNSDENKAETEATLLSSERVKVAAKAGLAAAATKAKLFADHEEREIQRLSANIINHQVPQLKFSMSSRHFCFNHPELDLYKLMFCFIYIFSVSDTCPMYVHAS